MQANLFDGNAETGWVLNVDRKRLSGTSKFLATGAEQVAEKD